MSKESKIIRPKFWSFMLPRSIMLVILTIIMLFVSIGLMMEDMLIGAVVALVSFVIVSFLYYLLYVMYTKESYHFEGNKIVRYYGTLFSDNHLELQLHRTAILRLTRPFLLQIFFGTGHIAIQAAGSSGARFFLQHIGNPKEVYEEIQGYLQESGFHLKKEKLVQEARPHPLGVFGEIGKKLAVTIFFTAYILGSIIYEFSSQLSFAGLGFLSYFSSGTLILIILGVYISLSYMDLKRRRYNIYEDAVEFYEGFLTKRYSVIPMENVSDVENTQSFLSKIFGLHDIKVSCAGGENEVLFKNMTQGEKMIENLKFLKNEIIPKERAKSIPKDTRSLISFIDKIEEPLKYDEGFTGEYRMKYIRSIAPYLLFLIPPLTPVGIGMIVWETLRVKFTDYSITPSSIDKRFHFLSNKHVSYSIEKITGMIVKRNVIDIIFGTCSVSFLSLGSSGTLDFSNIAYSEDIEKHMRQKVGIYLPKEQPILPIRFGYINFFKANIFWSWFLPLSLPIYAYKLFFYSQRFYKNIFFDECICAKKGIFMQTTFYALSRNIKGITSVKYPLTQVGQLNLNVAGEKMIQSKNKKGSGQGIMLLSHKIHIPYLDNVQDAQDYFDTRFFGTGFSREMVVETGQSVKNTLFSLSIPFAIFIAYIFSQGIMGLLVCIALLLGCAGMIVWVIRMRYFRLEKSRVIFGSGIIYKRRQSILYSKLNFIELNRGFLNKIFTNGSIGIYTLGSTSREMTLRDIDEYQNLYELLQTQ